MKRRLIVVPLIRRTDGRYLLIKMPPHRGVFPANEEFDAYARVAPDELDRHDMNESTRVTLRQVGVPATSHAPAASHSGP